MAAVGGSFRNTFIAAVQVQILELASSKWQSMQTVLVPRLSIRMYVPQLCCVTEFEPQIALLGGYRVYGQRKIVVVVYSCPIHTRSLLFKHSICKAITPNSAS